MDNFSKEFQRRIRKKEIKIAVVGLGYVGLPLAVAFAKRNFFVLGIDLDKDRVERVRNKTSYIADVPNRDLREVVLNKRFKAEDNFHSLQEIDVVLVCVPTPLRRKYHPDISFIKQAILAISKKIKKNTLVILESTTYPGTTEEIILPLFEASGLRHGRDFFLCFSPERIDPGNTKYTLNKIPKIIGGITGEAAYLGKLVYSAIIDKVVIVSSSRVAETAKLLENTFRIVNIGLIDEIAMMCHKMNIDIWEVIEAAGTKPFGYMPFYPGPGVGGHCIPKDPLYLYWKAKKFGFQSRFIKLASDIISAMPEYVIERLSQILKKRGIRLDKARVLVVGVTYKKDILDLRKSPALDIIELLQKEGCLVSYFDPFIPYLRLNQINLKSVNLGKEVLNKFHCVLIATDHSDVDYSLLLRNAQVIFDTRNVFKGISDQKVIRL